MGLEESAPPSPAAAPRTLPTRPPPTPPPETAAEKRRKLLGALEKCDDDLKTLRRIVAAVRAAEMRAAAASDFSAPAGVGKGAKWMDGRDEPSPSPSPSPPLQHQQKPPVEEHYPSPDSVLDAIASPRFPCRKRPSPCTNLDADSKPGCGNAAVGSKIVKPSRSLVFSGDFCMIKPGNELHAVAMYHHPVVAVESIARWILPPLAESEGWRHRRRWDLEAPAGRSRAMVESVGEVWGQGAGEERCETVRVGAALERAILHDLVGDVVTELLAQSGRAVRAPYGGHSSGAMCRKRLCF